MTNSSLTLNNVLVALIIGVVILLTPSTGRLSHN